LSLVIVVGPTGLKSLKAAASPRSLKRTKVVVAEAHS